jgi:hypothetical protein
MAQNRKKRDVFDSLLSTRWPMAPDLPEFPVSCIRQADDLIEQATLHLAAMDRELAALQRRARRGLTKALREQMATVRVERDLARMELLELVELAELPVELMGWA